MHTALRQAAPDTNMSKGNSHNVRLFGYSGRGIESGREDSISSYLLRNFDDSWNHVTRRGSYLKSSNIFRGENLWVAAIGTPQMPRTDGSADTRVGASDLAAAYSSQGTGFLENIHGSFGIALIDTQSDTTLIAIDRMGIESLAFAISSDSVVFGSSVQAVAGFPGITADLRTQTFYDYLLLHMVPSPDTVYKNVHKLRPGTYAIFSRGKLEVEAFWRPEFVETRTGDENALATEIPEALEHAVRECLPGAQTGAFLSGGLDSSSVAGMLCKVLEQPAKTFSIGFGVETYNELEYARLASRRFGTISHEYEVTADDIVTAFPKIAAAYDEPFGNSSAVPTYFCARLASEHGITELLAGDGGDEIFGGNERYARQKVFDLYQGVPRWMRIGLIEKVAGWIHPDNRITPLRKFRSYVDQARVPMPERLETWNFIYRSDIREMLHPEFLSGIDPRAPFNRMSEVYGLAPCKSLVNKMMFYDWHYTLADNDLRKVGSMCRLAGVDVRYPMLNQRLIDVALRTPPSLKVRGLELRVLYKKAMRDFLPAEIINKSKHGFGLPFGHWLKSHSALAEMIYGYLDSLKERRVVRPEFLDMLIKEHRTGHASYFGYAIWDIAMLEAWLQAHAIRL